MKILIGYDGSECADAALDDLTQAGLPPAGEFHLMSVAEVWLPPPPPSSYEIIEEARHANSPAELQRDFSKHCAAAQEALALVERARDRVQARFPNWKVTADSSCGSAAWELVAKADEWKPDLIVVGSHGRTALGRFVLGSVSQRVLTEALCSVRIARGRLDEPNSPVRIIVGTDGSPASEEALLSVAARKWPPLSEVKVIMVDDPLAPEFLGKLRRSRNGLLSFYVRPESKLPARSERVIQNTSSAKPRKSGMQTVSLLVLPVSATALKDLCWAVSQRRLPHARTARLKWFARV